MNKTLAIALCWSGLAASLAGCGGRTEKDKADDSATAETAAAPEPKKSEEKPADPPKTAEPKPSETAAVSASAPVASASAPPVASASAAPPVDEGPQWIDAAGGKKKLVKTDLSAAGLAGVSIVAPESAKATKSAAAKGTEIADPSAQYGVWLREDKTTTFAKLKDEAKTKYKNARFVIEDRASFIVANKGTDGRELFYYVGLYELGGTHYVCQTASTISAEKQELAEQTARSCNSIAGNDGTAVMLLDAAGNPTPVVTPTPTPSVTPTVTPTTTPTVTPTTTPSTAPTPSHRRPPLPRIPM